MPTIEELKQFLRANNVRGYSGKNKAQLLQMVEEYKNSEPVLQNNFISLLPNDIVSKIGTYLNYGNIIKISNLELFSNYNILSKFQTCATIDIPHNSVIKDDVYILQLISNLKNLERKTPNLQFLSLILELNTFNNSLLYLEVLEIIQNIPKFRKLLGLEVITKTRVYPLYFDIISIFNLMKLQYLSISALIINKIDLKNLLEIPTLIYLTLNEYSLLSHHRFNDLKINSKINTLQINSSHYANYRTDELYLPYFQNLHRLIVDNLHSKIMNQFNYIPDLEVLEFDKSRNTLRDEDLKILPLHIKFLRIDTKSLDFLTTVLPVLQKLEYISIPEDIPIFEFVEILNLLKPYKIKYLYITNINFNTYKLYNLWTEIKQIINITKTKVMFERIYFDRTYINLTDLWNVTLSEDKLFYTLKNTLNDYYPPNQWLIDHGYMLKPNCD